MAPALLLAHATVLVPDLSPAATADGGVVAQRDCDVLVRGSKIEAVGSGLVNGYGTAARDGQQVEIEVVDCRGKIVSPGFVDTHHHLWQTQLKGRTADRTLAEYFCCCYWHNAHYTPEDVFWGTLAGCLEAIDAGTTTVVDHAHCAISREHAVSSLNAMVASGLAGVYCYSPTMKIATWTPEPVLSFEPPPLSRANYDDVTALAATAPFAGGRVVLGLAFDYWFLPREPVVDFVNFARAKGAVARLTCHYVPGSLLGRRSLPTLLDAYGLLGPDVLLSHATNLFATDVRRLREVGAHVSSTPESELQMGHGWPVCFEEGLTEMASLGIDCQANNAASIIQQARIVLQAERARRNMVLHTVGTGGHDSCADDATGVKNANDVANLANGSHDTKTKPASSSRCPHNCTTPIHAGHSMSPSSLNLSVSLAFALATRRGALAAGRPDTGAIAPGMRADLVVLDATSPAMLAVADENPVAAIILHSTPRDVEAVLVDGVVRKWEGKLVGVEVAGGTSAVEGREVIEGANTTTMASTVSDNSNTRNHNISTTLHFSWAQIASNLLASQGRILRAIEARGAGFDGLEAQMRAFEKLFRFDGREVAPIAEARVPALMVPEMESGKC